MIYSRIKYGITTYGNDGSHKLNKIQVLQNQLLKVLLKKDYRSPTDELHKSMDILKVNDIAEQEIVTFVHNYFRNKLPPVFNDYYETLANRHHRNTRNGDNLLHIFGHHRYFAASSIETAGAKVLNKLNNNLKDIPKVKSFRAQFQK